jgi:hypothetical protein
MKSINIKTVEIRDRATLIPAFAIRMLPSDETELFLFKHCGYRSWSDPCILLVSIEAPWHSARSWDEWKEGRTMPTAHKYIEDNFDSITSCQVIDVEFILGEVDKPCQSCLQEQLAEMANDMAKLGEENEDGEVHTLSVDDIPNFTHTFPDDKK